MQMGVEVHLHRVGLPESRCHLNDAGRRAPRTRCDRSSAIWDFVGGLQF